MAGKSEEAPEPFYNWLFNGVVIVSYFGQAFGVSVFGLTFKLLSKYLGGAFLSFSVPLLVLDCAKCYSFPRPVMYLAMSYDHRLIDGREAVTFLCNIRDKIEDPIRMFLDC